MIALLIVLAIIGVVVYLVEQIPMSPPFVIIIRVLAVLFAILLILRAVGMADIAVPQLR